MADSVLTSGIPGAEDAASRTMVITGCARTGTSVLGRLLASHVGVEYDYEPPILLACLTQASSLSAATLKLLWETYVVEHVLLGALAGRTLNLNSNDESAATRYLDPVVVHDRLSMSHSYRELVGLLPESRALVKLPDIAGLLPPVLATFPRTITITTGREPEPVIRSVLKKGWFRHLTTEEFGNSLPVFRSEHGVVPFWVPEAHRDAYLAASEIERATMYYISMHKAALALPSPLMIDYGSFVERSDETLAALQSSLKLAPGPLTADIVKSISRPRQGDQELLATVTSTLRDDAMDTWSAWRSRAHAQWTDGA